MPSATFDGDYLHQDTYYMAAAYLFHITQNHPFVDGNKRTGAVASLVFLEINDISVVITENELEQLVIKVATSHIDKEDIADFLRTHYQKKN